MTTKMKKQEEALTIFTKDPAVIKGLSRFDLSVFYTKDGLFLSSGPKNIDDTDYSIPCDISTTKSGRMNYVSAESDDYIINIDLEKKGSTYTYSTIEYYDKSKRKQSIVTNESVAAKKNKVGPVKTLMKTIKSITKR